MIQTQNILSRVNVHSLRPVFHHFLTPQKRVLHIQELSSLPHDSHNTLKKTLEFANHIYKSDNLGIYMHRMVPFETTDPKVANRVGVICISRENVMGGYVLTKTKSIELMPGVFGHLPLDIDTTWYVSAIGEMMERQDTYLDVLWIVEN